MPPTHPQRRNDLAVDRERLERAARIYSSNRDAGAALGMAPGSFGRACRREGIETPQARRRRQQCEQRDRRRKAG